jgi:hypothetical protein
MNRSVIVSAASTVRAVFVAFLFIMLLLAAIGCAVDELPTVKASHLKGSSAQTSRPDDAVMINRTNETIQVLIDSNP